MPSFVVEIHDNQAFLDSLVGSRGSAASPEIFTAQLDTGAQRTLISEKVVNLLGLVPTDTVPISSVSGQVTDTDEFHVHIGIPIPTGTSSVFTSNTSLSMLLLPYQPSKFDVLLGMDFLTNFHITLFGKRIIISN
ncbi:MAG: hypothetical protein F4100_03680 [Rhodothermaceae bacterium]|nr:hypothetical protein [Rhodothermaceae bacterium]MYE63395.1 hypothetical protein [Rhodothermaceae bacterium]MYJ19838.1 hypothetical protein [Rhodothermaceae bacterium]